jgi:hypothetical protein
MIAPHGSGHRAPETVRRSIGAYVLGALILTLRTTVVGVNPVLSQRCGSAVILPCSATRSPELTLELSSPLPKRTRASESVNVWLPVGAPWLARVTSTVKLPS